MDEEKIPVMVIANRPIKDYIYAMCLELSKPTVNRIILQATDNNMGVVLRLVRLWSAFGIEEVDESRKMVETINTGTNLPIRVNQLMLRKLGVIRR